MHLALIEYNLNIIRLLNLAKHARRALVVLPKRDVPRQPLLHIDWHTDLAAHESLILEWLDGQSLVVQARVVQLLAGRVATLVAYLVLLHDVQLHLLQVADIALDLLVIRRLGLVLLVSHVGWLHFDLRLLLGLSV